MLAGFGTSIAAKGDMFNDFEMWGGRILWPAIHAWFGEHGTPAQPYEQAINMDILTGQRATRLLLDARPGLVVKASRLTAAAEPEKRHLEIQLPSGMIYYAGDYLIVSAMNSDEVVRRVLTRYSLPWDATITIKDGGPGNLLDNAAVPIYDVLKGYIELSQPATKNVNFVLSLRHCSSDKSFRTSNYDSSATIIADKAELEKIADASF